MRTPQSPEPFTERQVAPEIMKGQFETSSPQGAFGGISERNMSLENQTTALEQRMEQNAENYKATSLYNKILDQTGIFTSTAKSTEGMNSIPYSPSKADSFTSKFKQGIYETVADATKDDKKLLSQVKPKIDRLFAGVDREMQMHIAKQTTLAVGEEYKVGIPKLIKAGAAAYNDPELRETLQSQLDQVVENYANHRGRPKTAEAQKETQRANFQIAVMSAYRTNQDPKGGKEYLESLRKSGQLVDSNKSLTLQRILNDTSDTATARDFYRNASLVKKTANGYPDINSIISDIHKNVPQDKQARYKQIALTQYKADKSVIDAEHSDKMTKFKNVLSENPNTDTIIKTTNSLSWNGASRDAMLKLASNPKHGDLIINLSGVGKNAELEARHHTIYQGLMEGRIDQTQLHSLFNTGVLDNNSFNIAQKLLDSNNKSGVNAAKNNFSRSVRREINDAYAGDPDKATEFTREYYKHISDNPDLTVSDLRKYVDENLKPAAKDPAKFWDMLQNESTSDQMGSAEQTLRATVGASTLKSIQDYLRSSNPNNFMPVEQFHDYVKQLGATLDDMAVGQPINNALSTIIEWNQFHPTQPISLKPEVVLKAMHTYPNGFVP